MKKIPVGVLGATGVIGRNYVALLQHHPWFEPTFLAASDKSLKSGYRTLDEVNQANCKVLFSALPNSVAEKYEPQLAKQGYKIISHASFLRTKPEIPVVVPEINPGHLQVLPKDGQGYIVSKPNCSILSYLLPLAPLHRAFGINTLLITTLQSISGAGNSGLHSHAIHDNVIPFIPDEEEKSEAEPKKIFGSVEKGKIIADTSFTISAHCNRIPILHGHLACVSVSFNKKPKREEILHYWNQPSSLDLPLAPKFPVIYRDEPNRPQSRLDKDANQGMSVSVGRLRICSIFDWRFVALSHNTIRGGAGGGILIAELLYKEGYLG